MTNYKLRARNAIPLPSADVYDLEHDLSTDNGDLYWNQNAGSSDTGSNESGSS